MKREDVIGTLLGSKVKQLRKRAASDGKTSLEFLRDFVKTKIEETLTESVVLSPESLKETERKEVLDKLEEISGALLVMTFELCISDPEVDE